MVWKDKMILDLPGFDKIANKITLGLIHCFNEEKNWNCQQISLSGFSQKGPYHKKNSLWFLISGFLLYTVTGKITEIKTENAEATATHQCNEWTEGILHWCRH